MEEGGNSCEDEGAVFRGEGRRGAFDCRLEVVVSSTGAAAGAFVWERGEKEEGKFEVFQEIRLKSS